MSHADCRHCAAERAEAAGDTERKVALLLEHGVRADHAAAEKLVSAHRLRHLGVADFQHRIELLRMFDCSVQASSHVFGRSLLSHLLPLLAYFVKHECVSLTLS